MQTFVPYAEHHKTVRCLDRQRLGKQRVETLQILNALKPFGASKGWRNHPAVQMWKGHELALVEYGLYVCHEWKRRGYQDTCTDKIRLHEKYYSVQASYMPDWWGDPAVHDSHKSNLLRKNPEWYGKFDWPVSDDLPYTWPISTN